MHPLIEANPWSRALVLHLESYHFIAEPMQAHAVSDQAFLAAIKFVVNSEGGYVNDPHDAGGPTKFGVAWNFNAGWLKANGYTKETMQTLTLDDAQRCYYERYWLPSNAAGITSKQIAYLHLDSAVQHGCGKAAEFLKKIPSVKSFDFSGKSNRDLNWKLFNTYAANRMHYYAIIKTFKIFGAGWMNRIADVVMNAATKID